MDQPKSAYYISLPVFVNVSEPTSPEGAVDPEEQLLLPQPPSQGKAKLAPVPPSQPPSEDTEQLYPSPEDSVQPVPPNQTPAKRIELPSLPSLPPAEDKEPQHLLQPPSKVTEATHPRSLKAPQTFSKGNRTNCRCLSCFYQPIV